MKTPNLSKLEPAERWERENARRKAYYEANKQRIKDRAKAHYVANRDEILKGWSERYREDEAFRNKAKTNSSVQARRRRLEKYGMTDADYETMLVAQGGVCAICKREDSDHPSKRFAIDHDHATNKVRGILCHTCNRALGQARDSVEQLERMVEYLKRTQ